VGHGELIYIQLTATGKKIVLLIVQLTNFMEQILSETNSRSFVNEIP
jgi:hypothetical protein